MTTPEVSAIRDADRIIGLLEAQDLRDISLVINRIRPDMVKRGEMMSVDDVQEILAVPLLGILPDDEQVVIATNQGEAIAGSGSKAGEAFTNISHRILGESVPYLDLDSKRDFPPRIRAIGGNWYGFIFRQKAALRPRCKRTSVQSFNGRTSELFSGIASDAENDLSAAAGNTLPLRRMKFPSPLHKQPLSY